MLEHLDGGERARANRHSTSEQSAGFIAGRYHLRVLAAELVNTAPQALRSNYTCPVCGSRSDHGRPGYTLDGSPLPISLSLSRASGYALLGALPVQNAPDPSRAHGAAAARLGVDLEDVHTIGFDGFDAVSLSDVERSRLAALPGTERDAARARSWVRKEAAVKALGTGFSMSGPADVDTTSVEGITDLMECSGVILASLGLVAAVAVL